MNANPVEGLTVNPQLDTVDLELATVLLKNKEGQAIIERLDEMIAEANNLPDLKNIFP